MTTPARPTITDTRDTLAAQFFSGRVGAELEPCPADKPVPDLAPMPPPAPARIRARGFIGYAADDAMAFSRLKVLGPSLVSVGSPVELLASVRSFVLVATAFMGTATGRAAIVRSTVHSVDDVSGGLTCAAGQATFTFMRRRLPRDDAAH